LWARNSRGTLGRVLNGQTVKLVGAIAEALKANQRVDLRGFGSFAVKQKKERQGRNPRTGEAITIAAKRDAGFKAGKELTEKLVEPKTEQSPT